MAVLGLSLLGGFRAEWSSGQNLDLASKKACALLAYLALQPERLLHSREVLADLLWSESGPIQARASLRQAVAALRRACHVAAPGLLVVEADRIGIEEAHLQVDVREFERLLADFTPEALASAIALYRGPLLGGFAIHASVFEGWLQVQRERLAEAALLAFDKAIAGTLAREPRQSADLAHRLLALDPTRETGHRALMRLYAAQGERAAAIRQYQLCMATLRRELGVQPATETRDLYFEVLRSGTSAATAQAGAAPLAPALSLSETALIGRQEEFARLLQAMEAAAAGSGSFVALVGEAGIGKSRLVAELVEQIRLMPQDVLVGHCYDAEQILPYQAWRDALLPLSGGAAVRRLSADKQAALAALMPGVSSSGRASKAGLLKDPRPIFEAVLALLGEAAADSPLLLVLEDLHWADDLSLRLLAFLGRRLQEISIAIVATIRSEELDDVPILKQLLAGGGPALTARQIRLGPLSRSDTTRLVRALAGPRDGGAQLQDMAAAVWALGRGHPFMTVEATRIAQQGDMSALGRGMPRRIQELIALRLARLTPGARQVAAFAAVIGRPAAVALLREASGLDNAQTMATIEELVRRGVLEGVGGELKFTHDRIREVIYGETLAPIRKALHAAVARALAQVEAPDPALHYGTLAIHHRESEAWDGAQHCFYEAGLQALVPGGLGAAVECFEHAMQALLRLPPTEERRERRIEIYRALHFALIPLGRSVELRRHTEEIQALVDGGDRRLEGYVAAYRASDAYFTGALPQAIAHADRALAIALETADARLRDLAHHYLMFACHDHGDFARALGVIEARLSELRFEPTHISIDALVTCQGYRAGCHLALGDFAAARIAAAEGQRTARRWDSDYFVVLAQYATGAVELNATNWAAAIDSLEPALQLARRRDVGLMLPAICSALGLAYVHVKRIEEGISLLEQAVAGIAGGITMWGAIYEYRLAEGYFVAGRVAAARAAVRRALAAAEARGERIMIGWARWLEGEIALAMSDLATAHHKLEQAMSLARALQLRPLEATCRVSLARCLWRGDQAATAQAAFADGMRLLQELGMSGRLNEASKSAQSEPPLLIDPAETR